VRPAEAAHLAREQSHPAQVAPPMPGDLVGRLTAAVQTMDGEGVREIVALALENDPARGYDTVVSPALVAVGERWECGEVSVAAEHFGSQIIRHSLATVLRMVTPPSPAPRALLACIDEEQHDLGLLGLALHFASWGYRPVFLGARVPPKALGDAIAVDRPAIVALSVVVEPTEDTRALFAAYGKACAGVPWIVGGPGASALAEPVRRRGGHLAPLGSDELHRLVRSLAGV
jgi:methanogenic corrinoid protein MtbC1